MTHYFKICDPSTHFDQNECSEVVRGPFSVQISVSIDVRMQTNENEQVFFTLSRFWRPYWTSLWEEICNVKRSKDSFKEKIDTVIDVYCEKRNCAVKGHASNTPVRAKGTVADTWQRAATRC